MAFAAPFTVLRSIPLALAESGVSWVDLVIDTDMGAGPFLG